MGRHWKSIVPTSLLEALRLSKDCARERKNLSVERIAELMAVTPDALYKWLATGRMPASLIPAYENVCGCSYVSRYLATAGGGLVIDMPSGKPASATDIQTLQTTANAAIGAILAFAGGKLAAEEAIARITDGMGALGYHRANIQQHAQPGFDFSEGRP